MLKESIDSLRPHIFVNLLSGTALYYAKNAVIIKSIIHIALILMNLRIYTLHHLIKNERIFMYALS